MLTKGHLNKTLYGRLVFRFHAEFIDNLQKTIFTNANSMKQSQTQLS
jgi:hypothetical protein